VPVNDKFRTASIATLLRRVERARAGGDWTRAREEWEACLARARERVENVVGRRYKGDDPEAVVQEALIRAGAALVVNLDKLDPDAFFAAMVTLARYQCMDTNRSEQARRRHEPGSVDAPASWGDPDGAGRYDREAAQWDRERAERLEEIADVAERVHDAIARLRDPRAKQIIASDLDGGVTDDALAATLGITTANLQQIRSRAVRELRGLIDT